MSVVNFNVISSESNPKGGFLTKIQAKDVVSNLDQGIFGNNPLVSQQTYFVFGSKQMQPGSIIPVDVTLYNVVTREFVPKTGPKAGEKIPLKYLAGLK